MRDGAVHQRVPQRDERDEALILHAVGERAGDERGGDDGEGELVDPEHGLGDGGRQLVDTVGLDAQVPAVRAVADDRGRLGVGGGAGREAETVAPTQPVRK